MSDHNIYFLKENEEKEARIKAKEAQARELMQLILATNSNAENDPTLKNIRVSQKKNSLNLCNSVCLISLPTNMIDSWDIIHLKS